MTSLRLFVTGTDTDIGKTLVSQILLRAFKKNKLSTAVLKPVAAGAVEVDKLLSNDDAVLLQKNAGVQQAYNEVNPYVFADAIAPHLAAQYSEVILSVANCMASCEQALKRDVDCLLIEGAGGWLVPLNDQETMADLAVALQAKIILVVGIRLGCINHALLTVRAIQQSGAELVGWVANYIQQDEKQAGAITQSVASRVEAPLLGEIPYISDDQHDIVVIDRCVSCLDLKPLL